MSYEIGNPVEITWTIADDDGPADPDVLFFEMLTPDGETTIWRHGVDDELVKDSTGTFHVDWYITMSGLHQYRFIATGSLMGAKEGEFQVDASAFTEIPA